MKVLFVSSGNSKQGISPIVNAQGDSLENLGIGIDYFTIIGHGIIGYLQNVSRLRHKLRNDKYDLVHAHFSFSGIVATLAGAKPIVVSLMGWNVQKPLLKLTIKIFNKLFWDACIVKSTRMSSALKIKGVHVIPNGVNLDLFKPIDRHVARKQLGWDPDKYHFLCASDPKRPIKNASLALSAFDLIKEDNYELHFLGGVSFKDVVHYYNASDVVFLTSRAEGSPNVIKEALACNRKIVSTDVGDVRWLLNGLEGCYVTSHDPEDIASKIKQALDFRDKTKGRERLIELGLDSESVARRIVNVYERLMKEREL